MITFKEWLEEKEVINEGVVHRFLTKIFGPELTNFLLNVSNILTKAGFAGILIGSALSGMAGLGIGVAAGVTMLTVRRTILNRLIESTKQYVEKNPSDHNMQEALRKMRVHQKENFFGQ